MSEGTAQRRGTRRNLTTQPIPAGRTLCRKCWTTHYRRGRIEATCLPGFEPRLSPDELADIITLARAERIEADIAEYSRRKTS